MSKVKIVVNTLQKLPRPETGRKLKHRHASDNMRVKDSFGTRRGNQGHNFPHGLSYGSP